MAEFQLNGSDKLPTDNVVASIRTDTLWSKIRTQNANVPANDEAVSKTKSESRLGVEGVNISESSLASALRHPQYVYRVVLNRFRGGKLVNGGGVDDNTPTESYRAFPEMPPKKTSSSKLQTKKSTGEAQKPPAAQGKGAASPTTAAQKPDVKHKQYRNVDQPDGELPYKSGERPFPLREWKKISEPKETSSVDGEGFLNKLIIEGIHGSYAENVQDSSGERALSERESVPKGSSSEFAACFNVVVGQFLLHAGYEMYANVTREECRCLCAESWTAKWSTRRCKSFQYNALGECLLNKDNHFGKFDLVYDLSAEYHFINCSQPCEILVDTVRPVNLQFFNATASTLPENEGDYEEDDELTTGNYLTTSSENGIISSTDRSEIPQVEVSSPSPESCFEVIDGYVMKSTAGALENDVSLEECQCFCVTSRLNRNCLRALARYSFQCASATYYHNERDCVLNLDNRRQRPDLFHENFQKQFNVSYIGMLCSSGRSVWIPLYDSIERLSNEARENECRIRTSSTPLTTATSPTTKSISGKYTDNCFLELPNFVLEGTALAVEDNTTIEECKCYCIRAQIRYGTECQSLQYYFDSKTCLINKENRLVSKHELLQRDEMIVFFFVEHYGKQYGVSI
ncbi:unnamed protein product [Toxocara canis]|uniref:PAN domain protein n=1 Tax=Toxocara canis TaxID=6265 RepID=A0A183UPE8_TOXCA|nr:unnamed protein product [Toxocara canis]